MQNEIYSLYKNWKISKINQGVNYPFLPIIIFPIDSGKTIAMTNKKPPLVWIHGTD